MVEIASNYSIKVTQLKVPFPKKSSLESLNAGEIAELWATLTEAAKTDPEAGAFLAMFEPWAKGQLQRQKTYDVLQSQRTVRLAWLEIPNIHICN